MNKQRRKEIARAQALIAEARSILETCQSDEQDYYDNMPEAFQNGEKGEKAQSYADRLQEFVDSLEEIENEDFSE